MVSATLASVLSARRAVFNQYVAEAQHRWPSLESSAFAVFIAGPLDEVCQATANADAAATMRTCEVAFELGLELVAQGHAGPKARLPWVDEAWRSLAASLARLLARAPLETLGAISNAVIRLSSLPGVRVGEWISQMAALGEHCESVQALRDLGALCAWRAGMAHLRDPALRHADALPPALAAAAVGGAGNDWELLRTRLADQRWWNPQTGDVDRYGRSVGGFSGYGGPFATPPQVRATAEGFIAESAGRHHLLIADVHGAVVLPASAAEFAIAGTTPSRDVSITRDGAFLGEMRVPFAGTGEGMQSVIGPAGIALFSPWTHYVHLLPSPASS